MKVFVISLESATRRRRYVQDHFHENSLSSIEIINAVNGSRLSQEEMDACYSKEKNRQKFYRPLSHGEIGCALSHLHCYRLLLASQEKGAFIFEDDCKLNQHTKRVMRHILGAPLSEKALVLLTHASYFYKNRRMPLDELYALHEAVKANRGHGYYITRQAAENMLEEFKNVHIPIDQWTYLNSADVIDLFSVVPFCVSLEREHAERSDIGVERSELKHHRKKNVVRRAIKWLRPYIYPKKLFQKICGVLLGVQAQSSMEKYFAKK